MNTVFGSVIVSETGRGAAGGNTYIAAQDHGFMYGHGFQDLDGHVWEVFQMHPQGGPA